MRLDNYSGLITIADLNNRIKNARFYAGVLQIECTVEESQEILRLLEAKTPTPVAETPTEVAPEPQQLELPGVAQEPPAQVSEMPSEDQLAKLSGRLNGLAEVINSQMDADKREQLKGLLASLQDKISLVNSNS